MISESELREIDEAYWKTVPSIIEGGEPHRPILLCMPHGPVVDVGSLMVSVPGKDALGMLMQKLCAEYDMVCLISEAWVVEVKDGSPINYDIPPSLHPDRQEVVMVSYVVKGLGNCLARHIIRRDGNTVKLERGSLLVNVAGDGRFAPPPRGMPQH